jgi:hypothetical protein
MGLLKTTADFELEILGKCNINYDGLRICELGDQVVMDNTSPYNNLAAKLKYEDLKCLHTSIDINGLHDSITINLNNDIPEFLISYFDLVTNYGTSEHVSNQYMCFKNIHKLCKVNGLIIHAIPPVGFWPNHCDYYYTLDVMEKLAKLCEYELLNNDIRATVFYPSMYTAYKKLNNNNFISEKEFNSIGIVNNKLNNYIKNNKRNGKPWYFGLEGKWWWGLNEEQFLEKAKQM